MCPFSLLHLSLNLFSVRVGYIYTRVVFTPTTTQWDPTWDLRTHHPQLLCLQLLMLFFLFTDTPGLGCSSSFPPSASRFAQVFPPPSPQCLCLNFKFRGCLDRIPDANPGGVVAIVSSVRSGQARCNGGKSRRRRWHTNLRHLLFIILLRRPSLHNQYSK